MADALSSKPDFAQLLSTFCLALDLSHISSPVSDTLTDLVAAQKGNPFCAQLLHNLQTTIDPILSSHLDISPSGALVWYSEALPALGRPSCLAGRTPEPGP